MGKATRRSSKSSDIQETEREGLKEQRTKREVSIPTLTPVKNRKSKEPIMNSPITSKRTSSTERGFIRGAGEITLDPQVILQCLPAR